MTAQFPKHCRMCGAVHTAETWVTLDYIGAQDDGVEVISIRLCTCGTSLAIELGPSARASAEMFRRCAE